MSLNTYGDCFLTQLRQQGEYSGYVQANGKNFVKIDNKNLKHPLSNTNKLDNLVSVSLREKVAGSTAYDTFRLYDIVDGELWFIADIGDNNYYNIFIIHLPDDLMLLPSSISVNPLQTVDEIQDSSHSTLAGRVSVLEGILPLSQQQLGFIADVPILKTEMDAVEAKNVVQDTNIGIANNNIVSVNSRVNATNVVVGALQTAVALNTAKISYTDSAVVAGHTTSIGTLQTAEALNTAKISYTDSAVVAGHTTSIGELQTAEALNTAKISYTDSAVVAGHTTSIGTLQTAEALNTAKISYTDSAVVAQHTADFTQIYNGINVVSVVLQDLGNRDYVYADNDIFTTVEGHTTSIGTRALKTDVDLKAPINSPTFTGTVGGITKSMVSLGNVDNTSDANKPVSTAQQTALDLKANLNAPTFTGTVSGISKSMVSLGNVDNTTDANKPVSTAQQTALDLKANLNAPTFTGTVKGLSKDMIALGNVDNTSDVNKPVSTAQQIALNLKANLNAPTFTGTVGGLTKDMVGLENVDNTSDANKPISTIQQQALNFKANLTNPTFSGTVAGISKSMVGLGNVDNTSDVNKPISSVVQSALNLKADAESPFFTGFSTFVDIIANSIEGSGTLTFTTVAGNSISIQPHSSGRIIFKYACIPLGTGEFNRFPPIGAVSGTIYRNSADTLVITP